ncbi:probable WRKY transcription factor 51 isoform X1 [Papaver somniferum]|uniref:probable WRKY transcription factor 51 isoform X1 n=1 Tax=Papaver somniferum TaxID=3469 RepID=UPI000E7030AF|nr:probable WRKY transcription factor 51 isoform X1 [Papaver somniferum]
MSIDQFSFPQRNNFFVNHEENHSKVHDANPNYTAYLMNNNLDLSDFEVSDYFLLEHGSQDESTSTLTGSNSLPSPILPSLTDDPVVSNGSTPTSSNMKCKGVAKKNKADGRHRIAFRTKSEVEILDDGFKWRKYGKKAVKDSPNPRNYYRCSSVGCTVKKRVERDGEDSSYVITTYENVHNHESPSVVYYNEIPLMVPNGWTLHQQSSNASSSSSFP